MIEATLLIAIATVALYWLALDLAAILTFVFTVMIPLAIIGGIAELVVDITKVPFLGVVVFVIGVVAFGSWAWV